MSDKIDVLDHGYVRLVNCTGDDLAIVRAARTSRDGDARAGADPDADAKLIRRLMRDGHTSPFEFVALTFEVKAPIFVLRQWMRHRTWSYSEVSARYSEVEDDVYVPANDAIGVQSVSNKQGRDTGHMSNAMVARRAAQLEEMIEHYRKGFSLYRDFVTDGWPRELARALLPVATYSRMYAMVDLHNFLKFIGLRDHDHAQHEIRVYAAAMLDLARTVAPVAVAAWEETRHGWMGADA